MKRKRGASKKSSSKKSIPVASPQSHSGSPPKKARKQSTPKKKPTYTNILLHGKKTKISNKVLEEIKVLQRSTRLLMTKAPFARLIKEVCMEYGPHLRIQAVALEALQEATEMYLVDFFEDSYLCTLHAKRVTLLVRDMELARQIRKEV